MKITCVGKNLKDAIIIAERSTAKNQTLPILNGVYLEAKNGKLHIRSTNLEIALEVSIQGKVEKDGVVVVPAKSLGLFISNVGDDAITLQNQKDNLFIKTNKTETTIKGYPIEEFPLFPKVEAPNHFTISSTVLKDCLSSVVVACSTSDIKPELSSVFVRLFKNTIKFAATDSFRLAEKTIVSKTVHADTLVSILIPQKSVLELTKLLENEGETRVSYSKNQILIEHNSFQFISRLTEGVFPDYDQIIPKNFKTEAIAKRTEVVGALRLAGVFVGRLNDVSLKFDHARKKIGLHASNQDVGEHTSEIDAVVNGEEFSVKYNWRYLMDGMGQLHSEYSLFSLSGDQTPLLIRDKADNSFLYLIMPMRGV